MFGELRPAMPGRTAELPGPTAGHPSCSDGPGPLGIKTHFFTAPGYGRGHVFWEGQFCRVKNVRVYPELASKQPTPNVVY